MRGTLPWCMQVPTSPLLLTALLPLVRTLEHAASAAGGGGAGSGGAGAGNARVLAQRIAALLTKAICKVCATKALQSHVHGF
jgi:hypothetical protein